MQRNLKFDSFDDMSARLENETREEYIARRKAEQVETDAKLAGTVETISDLDNRAMRRAADKDIPSDDGVVLRKMAELCGDEIPLLALQLMYLKASKISRSGMIENYKTIISEGEKTGADTCNMISFN
jgi:hypothetical protein